MAPMTRYHCTEEGIPSKELLDYYLKRAENGIALIIIESCAVNGTDAMGYQNGAQLNTEEQAMAWKDLVDQVHAKGAKIWVQLFHAGRLSVKEITGSEVIAPSAIAPMNSPSFWRPKMGEEIVNFQTKTAYERPKEATKEDIERILKDFERACELAQLAGFDGVELHGAHGYLLHQFCHADSNQRTDEYAASPQFLFTKRLVKAVKNILGNTTLSYRLSLHMVDNSHIRYKEDKLNFPLLVKKLDEWGVDLFHSSELDARSKMFGGSKALHEMIREHSAKPIIVCGRINSLEKANHLLEKAELIAFGRNLISNPNLLQLMKEGKEDEIIKNAAAPYFPA
jgi:2,4-dienoyl-CoA reductase-like NADH-dependent reductase (Old Yellow Enzyme family)